METMTAPAIFRHNQDVSPILFVLYPTRKPYTELPTAAVKHCPFKRFEWSVCYLSTPHQRQWL